MDQEKPERAKYRLRFRKAGNLRLVSHHDLMHVFERMMRRAELPLCTTQGFHPQPRMIFAQSLALGVAGLNEVVELELKRSFPAEEIHARLVRQTPPGMEILNTRTIDFKAGARVRRAFYRLAIPEAMLPGLAERCAALLALDEIWVERTRPRPRRFNLRPYLNKLAVTPSPRVRYSEPWGCSPTEGSLTEPQGSPTEPQGSEYLTLGLGALEIAVWVTPYGTIRPDEVAHLLGLDSLLENAFFERTTLELYDEVAADDAQVMPACLLEIPAGSRAPQTDRKPHDELQTVGD